MVVTARAERTSSEGKDWFPRGFQTQSQSARASSLGFLVLHVKSNFEKVGQGRRRLDLDLLEAVLPDSGVGSDTVITEVNQDVPRQIRSAVNSRSRKPTQATYMASPSIEAPMRTS